MSLLQNIYYLDTSDNQWKLAFIVGVLPHKKSYLVSGYGPPVAYKHTLSEDEYYRHIRNATLEQHTSIVK